MELISVIDDSKVTPIISKYKVQ